MTNQENNVALNVLGSELEACSLDPLTGFYRDGCCNTGADDLGIHTVCTQVTEEFLSFSKSVGNDLSTPHPEIGFRGLVPGDRWCLCAPRWQQALEAGAAPPVVLESTHLATIEWVRVDDLVAHALKAVTTTGVSYESRPRLIVAYDDNCRFCRFCIAALARLDRHRELSLRPFSDPLVTERLSVLAPDVRFASMHAIGGRSIKSGGEGLLEIGAAFRMTRVLAVSLSHTRLGRTMVSFAYDTVARRRALFSRIVPDCPVIVR